MRALAVAALLASAAAVAVAQEEPRFTYEGPTGPEHWASLSPEYAACGSGQRQSPVELGGARRGDGGHLVFRYRASRFTAIDTGHSVSFAPGRRNTVSIGGRVAGDLAQLHFHAPSEHRVAGVAYPIELHFVHVDARRRITVVAVFVRPGARNRRLGELTGHLLSRGGSAVSGTLHPHRLLPAGLESIRYTGSLTTPPCTEGVRWIVLTEPITLSARQIARFTDRYEANNRPLQPLGDREPVVVG